MCIVSLLVWALICAISFMFAQIFKKYDYKSFMKELMGPGWVVFEIAYICFIVIVLAVVSASAGSILHELFGLNKWIGIIGMSVAVFALVMNGSSLIEKVLSLWSFVLYGVYILFLILVFANFSGQIGHQYCIRSCHGELGNRWFPVFFLQSCDYHCGFVYH